MSNLTKPLYFETMDEVHQFAERVVESVWELERALAEVTEMLDSGEIDEIDADEPVPFEPVDPVAQAREIVEELIMIDARRDDIRRCYKRIGRLTLPLAEAVAITALRKREKQLEDELEGFIGAEAALMTVFNGAEVIAKCHMYGVSWFYPEYNTNAEWHDETEDEE